MLVMKGMPGMLICLVLVCLVCIVSSMRRVCNFHFGGDGCKENRGMFEGGEGWYGLYAGYASYAMIFT